jgi:WD40 repeat protein
MSARLLKTFSFLFLLSACSSGEAPLSSLRMAVQGLHTGAISIDGSKAVVGSINHGGSLWELDKQERLFDWNHKAEDYSTINITAFSPEGQFAATADIQNLVLWNTEDGSSLRFWTSPGEILSMALGPNGRFALLGLTNFTAVLFDIQRGGILRVFQHDARVKSVSLSLDGSLALTGSEDETARVWDVQSGDMLQEYKHDDPVQLVRLSPDGKLALSVSKYDKSDIWSTENGQRVASLPIRQFAVERGMTFTAARFSEDGRQLLTGTTDRSIQLWNTGAGNLVKRWTIPKLKAWKPSSATVLDVAFSNGGYQAVASNGLVYRLKP